jgi:hypothetical protein
LIYYDLEDFQHKVCADIFHGNGKNPNDVKIKIENALINTLLRTSATCAYIEVGERIASICVGILISFQSVVD